MKKVSKYLAALFAVALLGALMVGCSGQQASSSASASSAASEASASASAAAEQTQDELFAELQALSGDQKYDSVTLDLKGTVSVDLAAAMQAAGVSGAADSAASGSADSAAAEGSDSAASSQMMEIPMDIKAKCDISSGTTKMSMDMNMMGMAAQLFIDGDNAVIVTQGQAMSATLEELNMSQYASVDTIIKSQAGDIETLKDAIQSIEKTTEGDQTVYAVTMDPAKFADANQSMSSLSQYGDLASIESVQVTYRFDANGKLVGSDVSMSGPAMSMNATMALTDYDSTVVDEAPEATMKYSDVVNGMANASGAASEAAEAASGEAAAA